MLLLLLLFISIASHWPVARVHCGLCMLCISVVQYSAPFLFENIFSDSIAVADFVFSVVSFRLCSFIFTKMHALRSHTHTHTRSSWMSINSVKNTYDVFCGIQIRILKRNNFSSSACLALPLSIPHSLTTSFHLQFLSLPLFTGICALKK